MINKILGLCLIILLMSISYIVITSHNPTVIYVTPTPNECMQFLGIKPV